MFAFAVRRGSHGIRDAAEVLLIWSAKNVNRIECGKKLCHNISRKALFPEVNTLFGKNKFWYNHIKYTTGNVESATSDWDSNRSNDIEEYLKKNSITIMGNNPSSPVFSIEEAGFPDEIVSVLRNCNVNEPTPIQSLSWPHSLDGRDFVGISKTGSGKTFGFIIPAVIHIKKIRNTDSKSSMPLALVLVPTRELAIQVYQVARLFVRHYLRCVCLYGGASKQKQFSEITKGADLCIATPGRILDFINAGALSLRQCSFLVLDEADRMLDMGFLPDLENIINTIECEKQVLMWSATWPKEVKTVAEKFLSDYIMIIVGSTDLKPNPNVRQIVNVVSSEEKKNKLLDVLTDIHSAGTGSKILIFVETKFGVDSLQFFLRTNRINAGAIHSGKTQNQREIILRGFREGRFSVLIATAVAARGLDIDDISHVINFDCPNFVDDYIHKIGRTARHDKTGTAITFVTPSDTACGYLLDVLAESNQEIPEELYSIGKFRQISFNARYNRNKKRPKANFGISRRNDYY